MAPGARAFSLALAASLLIHLGGLALGELALRFLMLPAPESPRVLEVRFKESRPAEIAPPPRVIKNTLDENREPAAARPRIGPPPEPARGTVARLAPPAESLPEKDLDAALERLSETLLYPAEALQRGLQGDVVLLIDLDDGGRIIGASVASSSGHAILDDAAMRAALRLGNLGPGPAGKAVLLPVRFRIQ
jgi:protein TonB